METDKVLARSYRSRPTVWLNSATVGNPAAGRGGASAAFTNFTYGFVNSKSK